MMPIGPLMIEHRLIERMIALMEEALNRLEKEGGIDTRFIERATQFIKSYADRCHHGKEEDILFRELRKKPVSKEHERIMNELVEEHRWGRTTTGRLVDANAAYRKGREEELATISDCLRDLVDFYPRHIKKEDKGFFLPVMDYFTQEEKDAMLKEGEAFDSRLLHEEYESLISELEGRKGNA